MIELNFVSRLYELLFAHLYVVSDKFFFLILS